MTRATWLTWLLFVSTVIQCEPAFAQLRLRVTHTQGDSSETTCVAWRKSAGNDGELWVGTLGGIWLLTPGGGRHRFDSTSGLAGNRVRDCAIADGFVWVATDAGLSRYHQETGHFVLVERARFAKLAGSEHTLLAARADGSLLRLQRGAQHAPIASGKVASALALSPDGTRFALGSADGSLLLGSGERLRKVALPERRGVVAEPIERAVFEADGARERLRASTGSREFLIDRAGRVTEVGPGKRSPARTAAVAGTRIPAHHVEQVLSGLLVQLRVPWSIYGQRGEVVATDAGLFVRARLDAPLEPSPVETVGFSWCGDRISALATVGDTLWIGSFDRGLCRVGEHEGDVAHFAGTKYLPSDMINALASDGRRLYVATDAGLTVIDDADASEPRFSQHTHAQCVDRLDARCPWHAAVNGVAVEPKSGAAWVGDIGALHRIDRDSGEWRHLGTAALLGSQSVTRVAAKRGEIAVGTSDRGLLLRASDGKRTLAIDDQHGLADNWITDLAYDAHGRLWIATCTHGLSVREPDGRIWPLGARDGLADDYVLSVQQIGGRIWVGTLRGVSVIDGGQVTSLSTADGLSGDEVHDAVKWRGAVWLATDGGLSVVQVEALPLAYTPAAR